MTEPRDPSLKAKTDEGSLVFAVPTWDSLALLGLEAHCHMGGVGGLPSKLQSGDLKRLREHGCWGLSDPSWQLLSKGCLYLYGTCVVLKGGRMSMYALTS